MASGRKVRLTKQVVDAATYEGKGNARCLIWDTVVPGFGLRVYPSGRKAFFVDYRIHGRRRVLTLGRYGPMTVEEARREAKAALGDVARGVDPAESRRRRTGATVAELVGEFKRRHTAHRKTGWQMDRWLDAYVLPAWGRRAVGSITTRDAQLLHERIAPRGKILANRVLSVVHVMFDRAVEWGWIERNPIRVRRFPERPRRRYVTMEELPRLARAIDEHPDPFVRGALWLYLYTGLRKSELLHLRWSDVDWAWPCLRLPDTKTGEPQIVPLSPPAVEVLRQIPRVERSPWVFPGPRKPDRPMKTLENQWPKIRAAAGLEDLTLHDLRRTVGAWLAQSGHSLRLVAEVLRHKNPATTAAHYSPFSTAPVKAALDAHARRISDLMRGTDSESRPGSFLPEEG